MFSWPSMTRPGIWRGPKASRGRAPPQPLPAQLSSIPPVSNQAIGFPDGGFAFGGGIDSRFGSLTITGSTLWNNLAQGGQALRAPLGGGALDPVALVHLRRFNMGNDSA